MIMNNFGKFSHYSYTYKITFYKQHISINQYHLYFDKTLHKYIDDHIV